MLGLPVVTTRHGGQASYVREGEDGYFVERRDTAGLIKKMKVLLGSITKARELGAQGKKSYREAFLAKRTAEEFSKIYINSTLVEKTKTTAQLNN